MTALLIIIYVLSMLMFLVEAAVIASRSKTVSLGYIFAALMIAVLPVLNTVCAIIFAVELDNVKVIKAKNDE